LLFFFVFVLGWKKLPLGARGERLVDKPRKSNTINIKLNRDKPFHAVPNKTESELSIEPIVKVIKINRNPLELEGSVETAASQESVDESFDWIIPESSENDIEEFTIASSTSPKKSSPKKLTSFSTNSKKRNGRPVGSILLSATFAILVGLTLGFIMLKLVITGPNDKVVVAEPTVVEEKAGTDSKTTVGKTTAATINQFTSYVIQGGVYTSKDGGQASSTQLTSIGVPSQVVKMNGKYYLFLGVADSIEMAKSLSGHYKQNVVEGVFAKPLLLDEKKFSDITENEKSFLEAVPVIYQTLSIATSSALVSKTIPEESSKALTGVEAQLKVSSLKNEKAKNLYKELTDAFEQVKAYQKSKDAKSLTEAQQHLLNFLSVYYSM
jgi:stage II sporulation protein B